MPRMALRRIPAPVDDEVGSVLDFAERASDLATQLGGYLSGAVSKRGVAVDHTSDQFGQRHGFALRLAGDVAEAVHQRHVGVVEDSRPPLRSRRRAWLACRRSARRDSAAPPCDSGTTPSPRLQAFFALTMRIALGVQFDVVADAAAERAGRVLDDRQAHRLITCPGRLIRPDRAARRTFNQAPGRESSRGSGAACSGLLRSAPMRELRSRGSGSADSGLDGAPCVTSTSSCHRLNFDLPALGCGHPGSVGVLAHEMTRGRTVRNENHPRWDLAFDALERDLAVLGPHAARSRPE